MGTTPSRKSKLFEKKKKEKQCTATVCIYLQRSRQMKGLADQRTSRCRRFCAWCRTGKFSVLQQIAARVCRSVQIWEIDVYKQQLLRGTKGKINQRLTNLLSAGSHSKSITMIWANALPELPNPWPFLPFPSCLYVTTWWRESFFPILVLHILHRLSTYNTDREVAQLVKTDSSSAERRWKKKSPVLHITGA